MRWWFALFVALLLGVTSRADDAIPMTIGELAQRAQLIVRGKVEKKTVRRDPQGRIYTEALLAVEEVLKGDPKKPLLTVVHGGGILGQQKVVVLGQVSYEPGEELVGFFIWNDCGEAVTLSMSQGKFRLTRNAEGKAEVANPYHGRGAAAADGKSLGLEELKRRVKEALR